MDDEDGVNLCEQAGFFLLPFFRRSLGSRGAKQSELSFYVLASLWVLWPILYSLHFVHPICGADNSLLHP